VLQGVLKDKIKIKVSHFVGVRQFYRIRNYRPHTNDRNNQSRIRGFGFQLVGYGTDKTGTPVHSLATPVACHSDWF
jgi:hypothetical protein